MSYEVELKFPVIDAADLESKIEALEPERTMVREEFDVYFSHPARDFSQTDEALRMRRVGQRCSLTYKGPKIDTTSKTRREIDLSLPPGLRMFDEWAELLGALGFKPVAEVKKLRRKLWIKWQGLPVEISLDHVDELGRYVELETLTEEECVPAARAKLEELAAHLGLKNSERRSYLELLLEKRGRGEE